MRRRLIPIAACLLIAACAAIFFAGSPAFSGSPSADTPLPARTAILPPNGLLQEGDWVFRHGTATDSRLIRELSRSRFSHIGIVVQTQPEVWIAHATTDDDPAHPNQVLLTPLAEFAAPRLSRQTAYARPRFLSPEQRHASARHAAAQAGRPFRLTARAEQPYYCTILLLDAVRTQAPAFNPPWQNIDLAVFRGEYLFPEAFAQSDIEWLAVIPAQAAADAR